jgi:hypothetical protein
VKSGNWCGDAQDFRYDAQVNMTHVEESGTDDKGPYHFTINNTFDEQNRFKGQTVSTGTFSSAQYVTDDQGNVTRVSAGGPEGLSRYFFNELGYEMRQEFKPVKGPGWTYERVRNPHSNATTEVVVRCHSGQSNCRLNSTHLWVKTASRASLISPQHARTPKVNLLLTQTLIYEEAFMTKGAGLKTRP